MTADPAPAADRTYLRIATEEAFAPPELIARWRDMIERGTCDDPGFVSLVGSYTGARTERSRFVFDRPQDLGETRLADMAAAGIDRQVTSLTAPGTQILGRDAGVAMATLANDRLADACRQYPGRFTGLTAIAPQDPEHAAREIERGHRQLGFKGVIINAHTHGEYLDDPKFWPIFEAAEALGTPIYLHPSTVRARRYPAMRPVQRRPSEYLRENVWVTTSGMAWAPAIMFCREVLGADRVVYAMDYPYQYVPGEVTTHENLPLTVADKAALFQHNAERVFGLTRPARP
jgi:predicted TIM-barrel fold metal-dependent hydrolase